MDALALTYFDRTFDCTECGAETVQRHQLSPSSNRSLAAEVAEESSKVCGKCWVAYDRKRKAAAKLKGMA